jgi:hypothetical protein
MKIQVYCQVEIDDEGMTVKYSASSESIDKTIEKLGQIERKINTPSRVTEDMEETDKVGKYLVKNPNGGGYVDYGKPLDIADSSKVINFTHLDGTKGFGVIDDSDLPDFSGASDPVGKTDDLR